MAYTSLTTAQTDAKSPIDEQMMNLIRTNEDDLDSRITTLEDEKDVSDYVDNRFDDGVVDPADPLIGSGNSDLTSTATTNPHGLSLADMRAVCGRERIVFSNLVRLDGEYDSDGRPAYGLPHDNRVRFYGTFSVEDGTRGNIVKCQTENDYFEVTAVCDSLALLIHSNTAADVEITVDGVTAPVTSVRNPLTAGDYETGKALNQVVVDTAMENLNSNIHHFKIAFDSSNTYYIAGVDVISDPTYEEMAGKAFTDKILNTFAKATLTLPTQTAKGARSIRYIDRADNTRKWATQNVEVLSTTSTAVANPADTNIAVTSSTNFEVGDIIQVQDSDSMGLYRITTIGAGPDFDISGTFGQTFSSGATVSRHCKTSLSSSISHDNEVISKITHIGNQGYGVDSSDPIASVSTPAGDLHWTSEDGMTSIVMNDCNVSGDTSGGVGIKIDGNGDSILYTTNATGLAVYVVNGVTAASTLQVSIDGVTVTTLADDDNISKVYELYSHAPVESHLIKLEKITASSDTRTFVYFIEYGPKKHTDLDDQQKGGELFELNQLATYAFYPTAGIETQSRGVVRKSPLQEWFYTVNTGAGTDFTLVTDYTFPYGHYMVSDSQAGGSASYSFFGTGFELGFSTRADGGIWKLQLDGSDLTTDGGGNYPSASVSETKSGAFTESTALLDTYEASGTDNRLAITGLTLGWHRLKVVTTGTKNGSSSNYNMQINYIDLIGIPGYSMGDTTQGRKDQVFLGSFEDKRIFASNDNVHAKRLFTKHCSEISNPTIDPASNTYFLQGTNMYFESGGGPVMVTATLQFNVSSVGAQFGVGLLVDGIPDKVLTPRGDSDPRIVGVVASNNVQTVTFGPLPLKAGRHSAVMAITRASGSGNISVIISSTQVYEV